MSARSLQELAELLGRPATAFPALGALEPDEIAVLADAIEAARERRRAELDDAYRRAFPGLSGWAVVAYMRRPR